jgi:murein L,D-transpeptidase YcbB/YkuD
MEASRLEALTAFYAARQYRPLWSENGQWSVQAKAAAARIARAAEDGLDPRAYRLPAAPDAASTDALASADIELSAAVVAYASQAQGGRIDPHSISPLITAKPTKPEAAAVLAKVAAATDTAGVLDSYNPPHDGFRKLRSKLAELRKARGARDTLPEVPAGRLIRPGMADPRVPVLRARLDVPARSDTVYNEELVEAVRAFQRSKGLSDEAVVGNLTLAALNDEISNDPMADTLVNMERWRWLPRDLGRMHVFVNIPEYHAWVMKDGAAIHDTRVVVGLPTNQTPVFSDAIQFMIVNPSWNVPYSIASKEMLPKLQQDPTYLARQGIEVVQVRGNRRQVIDSTAVDWTNTSLKGLHFRQPPGERNALGNIKFMFPNEHAVYLHDTPSRTLFGRATRSLSHGCVRVEDPFALAEVLLGVENGWSKEKVKRLIGGSERRINLKTPVPVHLAYFTAFVDDTNTLKTHKDIYGHDARMRAALNLPGH